MEPNFWMRAFRNARWWSIFFMAFEFTIFFLTGAWYILALAIMWIVISIVGFLPCSITGHDGAYVGYNVYRCNKCGSIEAAPKPPDYH
jgi:hypothetical protein